MKSFFNLKMAMMIFIVASLTFTSCRSQLLSSNDNAYRNVVGLGVVSMPQVADLEIRDKKIKETKKVSLKKGIAESILVGKKRTINMVQAIENAKQSVVSEILLKLNADVLFAPRFYIEQKGSTVSITVSGYAGTYKNFRAMTPQDSTILEIKPAVVNTVYKETTQGYENY